MRFVKILVCSASVIAAVLANGGCSSSDDGGTAPASSSSGTTPTIGAACAADTRKDIYTQGLEKTAGSFSIKMTDANPAPPAKGMNVMTIEIVDATGAPVDGATITVTPFMPDHGHGSAVIPGVTAMGGGKYSIANVYLAMAGLWRLTVTVQPSSGPIQTAAYQFCLDG